MIFLPLVQELELVGVFDRGVPNSERVVIRAKQATEMSQYGVFLGWNAGTDGRTIGIPLNDQFFWFGDGLLNADETIFLYTGQGEPRRTVVAGTQKSAVVIHWNRPTTLFAHSNIVPILFRLSEATIGQPMVNVPQLPLLKG